MTLKMHWIGVHPTPNWALKTYLDVFDQHFPELAPHQWGRPRKPLDAEARALLLSKNAPDIYIHLWHPRLIKRATIDFPFSIDFDKLEISTDASRTYSIDCTLQPPEKSRPQALEDAEALFVRMADSLNPELAVCVMHQPLDDKNISNRDFDRMTLAKNSYYHGDRIYGLPELPSWLLWLGERFSTQMNDWLRDSTPVDWVVRQTEQGTFVKISSEPTSPTEQPKTWFPRTYLPRRTIFGNFKPAKTLPHLPGVYGSKPKRD
ncbi:hypothetical protein ABYF32_08610 [Buchananella felis]|uniref:hypothetical protein n=1 Tax=Buchananella felis TaxID=3231492 RepID=UPI003527C4A7